MPVDYNREVGDEKEAEGKGEQTGGKECVNRGVSLSV
jgi:hypothetical protein